MTAVAGEPGSSGSPFSARTVFAMIAVGVVAFCGFLVMLAYAPQLRSGQGDPGAHALGRSAVGFAAIERLLRADGVPTVISRSERPPSSGLWVVTLTEASGNPALLRDRDTPILVVLPKWRAGPSLTRPGFVQRDGVVGPDVLARQIVGLLQEPRAAGSFSVDVEMPSGSDTAPPAGGKPEGTAGAVERATGAGAQRLHGAGLLFQSGSELHYAGVDRFQTFRHPSVEPLLLSDTGTVVLGRLPSPRQNVLILSDPDLLNNQGLRELSNARSAVLLMRSIAAGQGITFDVTLHGYSRGRSILRAAFEPPFLAATICFAAAALLMGLHAAVRFGPAARAGRVFALGKTALADNAAGLIALAGREARFLPAYAADTRAAVAREVGAPRELSGEALDAFLDRIGAAVNAGEPWTALNAEAHAAHGPEQAARVAARLHRWRTEMTRGR